MAKYSNTLNFRVATYRPGKDAHVAFYVLNPLTGRMDRKKQRVNHIPEAERKRYAKMMVEELNGKLYRGWSPYNKGPALKGASVHEAVTAWMNTKKKELRKNSVRSYVSLAKKLLAWMDRNELKLHVSEFETSHALRYMAEVLDQTSARTHNNYLIACRGMWNWLIEQQYCSVNPFVKVKMKRVGTKDRDIIPREYRQQIMTALKDEDAFRVAAQLVFYCLIRPNELTYLKPGNVDLNGQKIWIPASVSKNDKGEQVTIPDVAMPVLREFFETHEPKATDYLFSDHRTFLPGRAHLDSREFSRRWAKLRGPLNLPMAYKFYSLKDTGIVEMLEAGTPVHEVMHQARHSSLEVTSEYLKYLSAGRNDQLKQKMTTF